MLVVLLVLSQRALAGTIKIKKPARKGKATASLLIDGYTLVVVVQPRIKNLDADKLVKDPIEGMRVAVQPIGRNEQEILISMPHPVQRFSVKRRRGRLKIEIDYQERIKVMQQRVRETLTVPVPSTFVGHHFSAAEKLMRGGRFEDALVQYQELSGEYELRAWSQLRLGDIALLGDDLRGACRRYRDVVEAFGVRVSGMMARLRRQVLGCSWSRGAAADWDVMLERADRVPGRVGKFIRTEALWSMRQVDKAQELDLALRMLGQVSVKHRRLAKGLRHARKVLVARAIRLPATPLEVARMCMRHSDEVKNHPEGNWLRFRCAQAFGGLSLIEQAAAATEELSKIRRGKRDGGLWRKRHGAAQAAVDLARLRRDQGDADNVYATIVRFKRRFGYAMPHEIDPEPETPPLGAKAMKIGKLVGKLDKRVYVLDRAIRVANTGQTD